MAPYDDWNRIDDDEDEELQDSSFWDVKKDVILFCIDCSPSMLEIRDDPEDEDTKTSHLHSALNAAVELQKRKIITGPNDSFGILFFNTTAKSEATRAQGSEIKKNMMLFQPIGPLSATTIQKSIQILSEGPAELENIFPPLTDKRVPMGDVFTSCNWVIRDGAPKTATKRVFLVTDEDDPHSGPGSKQLTTSAQTTLADLTQAGVTVEPFFIQTEDKPFDLDKFYSSVLTRGTLAEDDEEVDDSGLRQSLSIFRMQDLLSQMRFREVSKRALFNIPFELAEGLKISVKGYGLVTEQKKGEYKYFDKEQLEPAVVKTSLLDEDLQTEVDKTKILNGMAVVGSSDTHDDDDEGMAATRTVQAGQRPFYTAEEMRSFRTLGLEPGLKLLGFKPRTSLKFEDNVKHSLFIYPDENTYSGSKRTFSALLKSMLKKDKIGLALGVTRRNSTPTVYALLPQAEHVEGGWTEPGGIHIIPIPFADDIRGAPVESTYIAPENIRDAAAEWIGKMTLKGETGYSPDSYPNPALAYHHEQLQASAFHEQYNAEEFEDLTDPNFDMIHKRAGKLLKEWKTALQNDDSIKYVPETTGSKRKADTTVDEGDVLAKHKAGTLNKLTVPQLKEYLKAKGQTTSGKKADLIERIESWISNH